MRVRCRRCGGIASSTKPCKVCGGKRHIIREESVDDKYITFKREDYETLLQQIGGLGLHDVEEILQGLSEREVPDAVVIRRQDVFAPPALDAYSNSIMSTVELIGELYTTEPMPAGLNDKLSGLKDVSTYFHEQAVESWNTNRKFPD